MSSLQYGTPKMMVEKQFQTNKVLGNNLKACQIVSSKFNKNHTVKSPCVQWCILGKPLGQTVSFLYLV